jgi:DNA-binding beta-propeller fold protein YncE
MLARSTAAALSLLSVLSSVAPLAAQTIEIDDAGVHLRASVASQPEGDGLELTAQLELSDFATRQPLTRLHPLAWLLPADAERAQAIDCKRELAAQVNGSLSGAAAVSFNGYRLVVLNDDATLSVINPQVKLQGTQLEAVISLPSLPSDWALDADRHQVYAALSGSDEIAVVSLSEQRLVRRVALPDGVRAERLYWDAPRRRLWAASAGAVALLAVEPDSGRVERVSDVGAGEPVLTALPDHHWLVVGASGSTSLRVVDAVERRVIGSIDTPDGSVSLAYSALAQRLYAVGATGHVLSIPPDGSLPPAPLEGLDGVSEVAVAPDGHYGFALHGVGARVSSFDTSTARVTASAALAAGAADIQFSARYAYVRGGSDDQVTLISLEEARNRTLTMTSVPTGMARAGASVRRRAGSIVTTPETGGAIIANTADRQLYFYLEGMMVPMGTLPTYGHRPLSLLIDDRSLAEDVRGRYVASAQWPAGGDYWLLVLLDQPRVAQCARVTLAGPPARHSRSEPVLALTLPAAPVYPGVPAELRLERANAGALAGTANLGRVRILVTDGTGRWQRHLRVEPAGDAGYHAFVSFPSPGVYHLMLKSDQRELQLGSSRSQRVTVSPAPLAALGSPEKSP